MRLAENSSFAKVDALVDAGMDRSQAELLTEMLELSTSPEWREIKDAIVNEIQRKDLATKEEVAKLATRSDIDTLDSKIDTLDGRIDTLATREEVKSAISELKAELSWKLFYALAGQAGAIIFLLEFLRYVRP